MFDTPLGVLLALFQEDRYFWAILDEERHRVDCRFCDGHGDRPENVQHLRFCVIEMATQMIMNDESLLARVRNAPPRHVYHGTATLTVYRKGIFKDDR